MDLGKDKESLHSGKDLGLCGLMDKRHHLMMAQLEEDKDMECIHLLWYRQLSQENIWEYSLEILMLCLRLLAIRKKKKVL
jgi:hypothetical protein